MGAAHLDLPAPDLPGLRLKTDELDAEGKERTLTYARNAKAGPDFIVYLVATDRKRARDRDNVHPIDYTTYVACCCDGGNGEPCGSGEGDAEYVGHALVAAAESYADHLAGT